MTFLVSLKKEDSSLFLAFCYSDPSLVLKVSLKYIIEEKIGLPWQYRKARICGEYEAKSRERRKKEEENSQKNNNWCEGSANRRGLQKIFRGSHETFILSP